jgi:CubicO group peptidase (beta-lactamase class C family)
MIKSIQELEEKIKKKYKNITGVMVQKNDQIAYEQYFNDSGPENKFHIYSVTKSIVAILIGIAVDKGLIKDINHKVLDFFPNYEVKQREKTIYEVTIKDILTMTAPYKYRIAPYIKYFKSNDYLKVSLDLLGGKGNIGDFKYTPLVGPDILSGILQQVTGQSMYEFANQHLFGPLKIEVDDIIIFTSKEEQLAFNKSRNISGWVADSKGLNTAGWGLSLSVRDMTKIGKLMLNDGLWEGEQIVSKDWTYKCITQHSLWNKLNLAYGLLWWVIDEKACVAAAIGDGGNVVYFNDDKDIVVSITASFKPRVTDRIDFIRKYIEPCFE